MHVHVFVYACVYECMYIRRNGKRSYRSSTLFPLAVLSLWSLFFVDASKPSSATPLLGFFF